jgi:formamidopyrimidine-DNA glycosylase
MGLSVQRGHRHGIFLPDIHVRIYCSLCDATVKQVLLAGGIMLGMDDIYACEALFLAGECAACRVCAQSIKMIRQGQRVRFTAQAARNRVFIERSK